VRIAALLRLPVIIVLRVVVVMMTIRIVWREVRMDQLGIVRVLVWRDDVTGEKDGNREDDSQGAPHIWPIVVASFGPSQAASKRQL
jgi:hypothetical protein